MAEPTLQNLTFELAGARLDWPIGSTAGLTNHPDINRVGDRLEQLASSGLAFETLGSISLGEVNSGYGYTKTADGAWEYQGGDEYVDVTSGAGYNVKKLPNPGSDVVMQELDNLIDIAKHFQTELAISFSPHTNEPLEELEEILKLSVEALARGVLFGEINLACPNMDGTMPFYKDLNLVGDFLDMADKLGKPALNYYDHPGLYVKFGPDAVYPGRPLSEAFAGAVTSNTLGNQVPLKPDGNYAIEYNQHRAGMSGPALREVGQLELGNCLDWVALSGGEVISVLGIDSGAEIKHRLDHGASAVEVGSILYWPELVGLETPRQVVDYLKDGLLEAYGY